jgi:hypothetical protein
MATKTNNPPASPARKKGAASNAAANEKAARWQHAFMRSRAKLQQERTETRGMQLGNLAAQFAGGAAGGIIRRKFGKDDKGVDTLQRVRLINFGSGVVGALGLMFSKNKYVTALASAATGPAIYQIGREAEDWTLFDKAAAKK